MNAIDRHYGFALRRMGLPLLQARPQRLIKAHPDQVGLQSERLFIDIATRVPLVSDARLTCSYEDSAGIDAVISLRVCSGFPNRLWVQVKSSTSGCLRAMLKLSDKYGIPVCDIPSFLAKSRYLIIRADTERNALTSFRAQMKTFLSLNDLPTCLIN